MAEIYALHDVATTAGVSCGGNAVAQLLDALELSFALAPVRVLADAVRAEKVAGDIPAGPSSQVAECLRYQNEFRLLYGERVAGDGRPWSELLRQKCYQLWAKAVGLRHPDLKLLA